MIFCLLIMIDIHRVNSVGTDRKQFFMPAWPTLYPGLLEGKSNERIDTRVKL